MKTGAVSVTLGCLLLALPLLSVAQQIYKWTDANGQVHFSDQPPPKQETTVVGEISRPLPPPKQEAATGERVTAAPEPNYLKPVVPGTPEHDALMAFAKAELEKHAFKPDPDAPPPMTKEDFQRALVRSCEKNAIEKKKREQAIVAACKARRESYCDEGIAAINRAESSNGIATRGSTEAARMGMLARGESPPPASAGMVTSPRPDHLDQACAAYLPKR